MLKRFLSFFRKYFQFAINYQTKPLQSKLVEGPNWSIDQDGNLKLFNYLVCNSYSNWTASKLAERLEKFLSNFTSNPELSKCVFRSVMIDQWVAADLYLNGDITLEQLEASKTNSRNSRIILDNFRLGSRKVILEISDGLYYESYQFAVTGHPQGGDGVGFMAMRDVPDLLAIVANEKVEGVAM